VVSFTYRPSYSGVKKHPEAVWMLRKSKRIYDLSVNQTPHRPVHILCNMPPELTPVFEFSLNRPVTFTDFMKLRRSLVVYPLKVYNSYKNSLGLHSGVAAVSVVLGYGGVELGSAYILKGLNFERNSYNICENRSKNLSVPLFLPINN
jgi:hypothetical protein